MVGIPHIQPALDTFFSQFPITIDCKVIQVAIGTLT